MKPTLADLECWAAGDNGASDAASNQEALDIWDKHARDPRVMIYRKKNVFLRRVELCNYDEEEIADCTHLLEMYPHFLTDPPTEHVFPDVPIWALEREVAKYQA
jgi:hypothetical protein